jgi:hypothetical protein
MSKARAARRRQAKQEGFADPSQMIQLQNPVASQFGAFIVGNAQFCDQVAEENEAKGQHLIICGAGPSLAEHAAEWCPKGDQVWGCNSAMIYLHKQGHKVTHGFTVDQTAHMLVEWYDAPDVDYLIASTAHPHLVEHLLDRQRRLTFFHNFVGIQQRPVAYGLCKTCNALLPPMEGENLPPTDCLHEDVEHGIMNYEDWLYQALYPPTIRAGSGLNAVTRAIDVGLFMGFSRITVLGADCALKVTKPLDPSVEPGSPRHLQWLREDVVMHADGGHALTSGATAVTMGGVIDGRHWETKPDLIISAVWLELMRRKFAPRIELVGDTLPNALKGKSKKFLSRLPTLVDSKGNPVSILVD